MRHSLSRRIRVAVFYSLSVTGLCAVAGRSSAADPPAPTESRAPTVEVISTTPLPGLGVPKDEIPGKVQTATDADLRKGGIACPISCSAAWTASTSTRRRAIRISRM